MKRFALTLIFALPLVAYAGEVRTGDSLGDVRAALGAPRGEANVGNRQLLYYDRGEVELQAGAVTRVGGVAMPANRAIRAYASSTNPASRPSDGAGNLTRYCVNPELSGRVPD